VDTAGWSSGVRTAGLLRERARHVLEEHDAVRRHKRVVIVPIDLELAVGVLVISLVRPPAKFLHILDECADQIVSAHQRVRVVARLGLHVQRVAERGHTVCRRGTVEQKELALDAGL